MVQPIWHKTSPSVFPALDVTLRRLGGTPRSPNRRRPAGNGASSSTTGSHRDTRWAPADTRAQERARLHTVPDQAYTVMLGAMRQVPVTSPMVTFECGQHSVPHTLLGQTV